MRTVKYILGVLLFANIFVVKAEVPGVHRFATYNIRYVNANNGDTGDRLWANRRQYVAQIVKDYDFDIFGMQELTGNNKDPQTGKSQMQDLQDLLPDYTLVAYERENKQYSYTGFMYKTAKYDCLEHGSFWISQTPDRPSLGWTAEENHYRRVVWGLMQVIGTDEQFYFCATHTNYGPTECGIEGAKLVSRLLHERAGQMPIVLAGDFNMRRAEHKEAYRGYASMFYDAALTAMENYSLPTSNPATTATTTGWTPVTSSNAGGSEFDYLFYDHMTPLGRHIITENYGRGSNPSDHYPVLVRFRIGDAGHSTRFTVTTEEELRKALQEATMNDTICIAAGHLELTEAIRPACSLCMIGGYNSNFTQVVGTTVLSGKNLQEPLVNIPEYYSLVLHHLQLQDNTASSNAKGGAIYSAGAHLALYDCRFVNNTANTQGGAIYAETDSLIIERSYFESCSAKLGGAVSTAVENGVKIRDTHFVDNTASDGGAAVMASEFKTFDCQRTSFTENSSSKYGTLYLTPTNTARSANLLNCSFLNNTLSAPKGLATITRQFGGAAVNVKMNSTTQTFGMGHCTIMGNRLAFDGAATNFVGAAVNIFAGKACVMNSIILGNTLQIAGAEPVYADMEVAEAANLWRNTYNLTSASSEIAGWEEVLLSTFEGTMQDKIFSPKVTADGVCSMKSPQLAGYDLCCLPTTQRLCESAFMFDLNGDGTIGGYVAEDELGRQRAIKSCIGALEYEAGTDVDNIWEDDAVLSLGGCQYRLPNAVRVRVCNVLGQTIKVVDDNVVDISLLPHGVYFLNGYKVIR